MVYFPTTQGAQGQVAAYHEANPETQKLERTLAARIELAARQGEDHIIFHIKETGRSTLGYVLHKRGWLNKCRLLDLDVATGMREVEIWW
jgi:hypothetical protein